MLINRGLPYKLRRQRKDRRIPLNRVCPAHGDTVPNPDSWAARIGYIPVCLKCWHAGIQARTQEELEILLKERVILTVYEKRKHGKYKRLIGFCGKPPKCWSCGTEYPYQEPNERGVGGVTKYWVVKPRYRPTCRSCWNKGIRVRE